MNEVFVIGKIISKIEYKFMIHKKYNAIAKFRVMLENNSIVKVKAYNDMADKVLRKYKIDDYIFINGKINSKMEIIVYNMIVKHI